MSAAALIHFAEWGNWTTGCGIWADSENICTDRRPEVTCQACQASRRFLRVR